ncbi:MAG: hypothetical protein IPF53_17410 [Blastocatellia bacterium]|nr:hypothetical protein [Blastocatellia bacterium]
MYGFCMGFGRASLMPVDESRLADLRRSGVVRAGADPLPVPETVAAGDPLLAAFLPGGGFPCGHITEVRGAPSSGRLSVAVRAVLRALALGQRPALVTTRGFFPGLAPWLPAALHATLVCRVADLTEGLGAAEVLATAGAVDLLIVDVAGLAGLAGDPRPAGADASLARLERAARAEQLALVLLTDERSAATIGLSAKPCCGSNCTPPRQRTRRTARRPPLGRPVAFRPAARSTRDAGIRVRPHCPPETRVVEALHFGRRDVPAAPVHRGTARDDPERTRH